MKSFLKNRRKGIIGVAFFFIVLFVFIFALCLGASKGKNLSVKADENDGKIEILKLDVDVHIREDRQIEIAQSVKVKFNNPYDTMFYQALPLEGDRYYDIVATCPGNEDFYYKVADNPQMDGFMDINCIGGVYDGAVWTYNISYKMEVGVDDVENGMILDVVGFGSSVPLHDVSVTMHFPSAVQSLKGYVGGYGSSNGWGDVTYSLSEDKKTLKLYAEKLEVVYNETFYEEMAQGITVEFAFADGVLQDFATTRTFTKDLWKILLGGLAAVGVSVLLRSWMKKREEVIPVITMRPPNDMDPLFMGKFLDNNVDNEDITSMIYYFAEKGYLKIDFSDENDPLLIQYAAALPPDAPVYQHTLFNGLFAAAKLNGNGFRTIKVSQLVHQFYYASETAKAQVPAPKNLYDKKSLLGFVLGGILSGVFALLTCLLLGLNVGGGYMYTLGAAFFIPILLIRILGYVAENYRYKWKPSKQVWMKILQYVIAVAFTCIFTAFFAKHIMTESEKILLSVAAFVTLFISGDVLGRDDKHLDLLGQVLGFKDFIVYTEEDKIKFMLEEDPHLYYHILPYAQVLGVTNEWEQKFAKITLEPPTWYVGPTYSDWNAYFLARSLDRAVTAAMIKAAMAEANDTRTGFSGGGGSFGGFGGGGHGGGGFGSR